MVSTNLPVTNMVTADIVIPTNEKSSVRVASVDNMNTIRLHKIEVRSINIMMLKLLNLSLYHFHDDCAIFGPTRN